MIDPDETLSKIRQAIDEGKVDDAAEQFCLLDQLLTLGGKLPMTWAQAHRPTNRVGNIAVPMDEPEPLGGPVPGTNGWHMPEEPHA
jgi:hypothetical protein